MRARLWILWESLRSSLWFMPALMAAAAALLSVVTVRIDQTFELPPAATVLWIYSGGAEGARGVLSVVAASMIGIAGTAFSITIVALSLAATQLGPRLLRNFMRDPGNQVVLGTFIGAFVYCVLVLRTIQGADGAAFVPHLSITVGVALGMAGLGVLIYFIHHVSSLIQAPTVISTVAAELEATIARLFPQQIAHDGQEMPGAPGADVVGDPEGEPATVAAPATGYVQAIDGDGLLELASRHDLVVKILRRPGHFVVGGNPVALAWPRATVTQTLARRIARVFTIGAQRTPTQDAEFAVHQLVEIALRALSPGINDPFTAMTCVDRLGAGLWLVASRTIPSPYRHDAASGALRVIANPITGAGITDAAFNQIRQAAAGRSETAVMIRLLETIAVVAPRVRDESFRQALRRQATMIATAGDALPEPRDRRHVLDRYEAAMCALAARREGE